MIVSTWGNLKLKGFRYKRTDPPLANEDDGQEA